MVSEDVFKQHGRHVSNQHIRLVPEGEIAISAAIEVDLSQVFPSITWTADI